MGEVVVDVGIKVAALVEHLQHVAARPALLCVGGAQGRLQVDEDFALLVVGQCVRLGDEVDEAGYVRQRNGGRRGKRLRRGRGGREVGQRTRQGYRGVPGRGGVVDDLAHRQGARKSFRQPLNGQRQDWLVESQRPLQLALAGNRVQGLLRYHRDEDVRIGDASQDLLPPRLPAPQREVEPRLVTQSIEVPDQCLDIGLVLASVRDEQLPHGYSSPTLSPTLGPA